MADSGLNGAPSGGTTRIKGETIESEVPSVKYNLASNRPTNGRSLAFIPPKGDKGRGRVAIGDTSGSVAALGVGDVGNVVETWKVPIAPKGTPIVAVESAGDRSFVAFGNTVQGISRTGKPFFTLETNTAERIQFMRTALPLIYLAGEVSLNVFDAESGRHAYSYLSTERITSMEIEFVSDSKFYDAVFGCADATVRVIQLPPNASRLAIGSQARLFSTTAVDSAVSALAIFNHPTDRLGRKLVYGSAQGRIGLLNASADGSGLVKGWSTSGGGDIDVAHEVSAITCGGTLPSHERSGLQDIVVGRRGGAVELWRCNEANGAAPPTCVWKTQMETTVTGLALGSLIHPSVINIIASSFGGETIAFGRPLPRGALREARQRDPATEAAKEKMRDRLQQQHAAEVQRNELAKQLEAIQAQQEALASGRREEVVAAAAAAGAAGAAVLAAVERGQADAPYSPSETPAAAARNEAKRLADEEADDARAATALAARLRGIAPPATPSGDSGAAERVSAAVAAGVSPAAAAAAESAGLRRSTTAAKGSGSATKEAAGADASGGGAAGASGSGATASPRGGAGGRASDDDGVEVGNVEDPTDASADVISDPVVAAKRAAGDKLPVVKPEGRRTPPESPSATSAGAPPRRLAGGDVCSEASGALDDDELTEEELMRLRALLEEDRLAAEAQLAAIMDETGHLFSHFAMAAEFANAFGGPLGMVLGLAEEFDSDAVERALVIATLRSEVSQLEAQAAGLTNRLKEMADAEKDEAAASRSTFVPPPGAVVQSVVLDTDAPTANVTLSASLTGHTIVTVECVAAFEYVIITADVPAALVPSAGVQATTFLPNGRPLPSAATRAPATENDVDVTRVPLHVIAKPAGGPARRIALTLRVMEGSPPGTELSVMVVPADAPRLGPVHRKPLLPLCGHARTARSQSSVGDIPLEAPDFSTMTFTGEYTLTDIRRWLEAVLPDVPSQVAFGDGADGAEPTDAKPLELWYTNPFSRTILCLHASPGRLEATSDSPLALRLLSDAINAVAGGSNTRVRVEIKGPTDASRALHLLKPKVDRCATLSKRVKRLHAARELAAGGDGTDLSEANRALIEDSANIDKEAAMLDALWTELAFVVMGLQKAVWQMRGTVDPSAETALREAFAKRDLPDLGQFFTK